MNEEEQVQYLANIFHVARADARVEVQENSLVEKMAKGIGAGYLETRNGLDLAMGKNFEIKFPERFSERIRNLEDMLVLAYSDKNLHELEKKIIIDFAKEVGVNQTQIKIMQKEAKKRMKDEG